MPQSAIARLLQRPGLLGGLLFATAMGLAAAIAYQAVRSAESHRASAEASLKHHATIAAWRFAREARSWLGYGMGQAEDQLRHELTRQDSLPGPELLKRVLAEKECDCMTAGFGRTFFRVVPGSTAQLQVLGEPLSERAKDSLIAVAVRLMADTASRRGLGNWRMLSPGQPRLTRATDVALLWKIVDDKKSSRAIYGMVVEPAQIQRPLRGALENAQFFPPTLVPPARADSLVRIDVAGANAAPVFESGPDTKLYSGSDTLGAFYGDLTVTASIAPGAAQLLLDGSLPVSRAPMIVGLLALALAVGVGALVLLRREHRLARLREDFVSGVSHELRTPLTQIRMLSELLQSDGFKTDAERARATNVIHRESLRLSNLVDNILEFTRLRRSAPDHAPMLVSLSDTVRELAESFAPLLDAVNNRLELVIPEEMLIPGDRDAVSRVLRNLVENAMKYGPRGQTIRITLCRSEVPAVTRVTIDDEGAGIPVGERERVWQPYYRIDRDRNASAGGSGIGLSVVADLMQMLGGKAWVTEAPVRGARFIVEFPNTTPAQGEVQ